MGAYGTTSARQWAQLAALGLVLVVAIVMILAVVLPTAAIVLALALAVTGVALVAQRATAAARSAARAVSGAPAPEAAPQSTLRLELPDGEVLSARPVPLPHEGEHTLLLTRDGYVIVNAEGRVIYRY